MYSLICNTGNKIKVLMSHHLLLFYLATTFVVMGTT